MTRDTPPPSPVSRRRRLLIIFAVVLVLLVGSAAAAVTVIEQQSGPLSPGNFGGVLSLDKFSFDNKTFTNHLVADQGQLLESMFNGGSHPIKITSIDPQYSVISVQWSKYVFVPGGNMAGLDTPWQNFPATIPAHGGIRLLVTLQRPTNCPAQSDGVEEGYSPYHNVHWDSMLFSHTTWLKNSQVSVDLC